MSISPRVFLSDTISFLTLTFCLEDLSIFGSGVLKSPAIIVLLSIPFLKSSKIFFMYFGCSFVGCLCIYNFYVLLVDSSFEHYEVTFWVSFYDFYFEVYFVLYKYVTPALFFFFSICLEYFFPALHFQSV